MAKRKNTKDLLAERNPLQRVSVEPVDIYAQDEAGERKTDAETTAQAARAESTPARADKRTASDDPLRPYSTYLRRSQVKNIKRHAVEREIKDMLIMQEAVDEYLRRHKL